MSDNMCSLRELYALGALSEAERSAFEIHLQTCTECQQEIKELEAVTEALLFDMEPVSPPTGMRQRVLDNILGPTDALPESAESKVEGAKRDIVESTPPRRVQNVRRTRPWFSLSAAAIVLVVIASGVTYSVTNHSVTSPFGHVQKSMALNSKIPGATATMWVTKTDNTSQMVIHFTHLKPVGGTQVYQVWLIQKGASIPYSAGVFTPDKQGNAVFASIMPQGSYQVVAVTLEPKAIDAKPLGPVVFEAET